MALRDEMEEIVKEPVLAEQMKDVIEYRAMDYYRRRYKEKIKHFYSDGEDAYGIRNYVYKKENRLVYIDGRLYIAD